MPSGKKIPISVDDNAPQPTPKKMRTDGPHNSASGNTNEAGPSLQQFTGNGARWQNKIALIADQEHPMLCKSAPNKFSSYIAEEAKGSKLARKSRAEGAEIGEEEEIIPATTYMPGQDNAEEDSSENSEGFERESEQNLGDWC